MTEEVIEESPTGWVAEHVRRYLATDGADGATFHGYDSLLLTTRGRTSGKLRRTALIYGRDGDRVLLVASNGGAARHPHWYLNLDAHPEVGVQIGAERFTGRARTASAAERPRLWELMVGVFPQYATYQRETDREIPVVVVERG
ncbi:MULTISPECIES: nitroreductase family deazaflavin-dependent oxidoreductase [Micromonospora]|uniref:Deazaflavin-dependent oxidoreductase, nitroreductase family n=1 Tax=Micromonospora yangpuensis TaxID=683228 RepID=A0A1C6UZ48_9ACTN|nr:nitroreductase family deazaflavin-dependent oxidoreductase [Micromonospora yangpuensis]GGL96010.1 nitroreductase [Micromonospora yangpuensis]SCL59338.1 deazaflavin-dependent oxidoreductase, nitroreductase family [Micromonospora yangpuensis]